MKSIGICFLFFFVFIIEGVLAQSEPSVFSSTDWFSKLDHKYFVENNGQVSEEKVVHFSANLNGVKVDFYEGGFSFTSFKLKEDQKEYDTKEEEIEHREFEKQGFDIVFENSNVNAKYIGEEKLIHYSTFSIPKKTETIVASNYSKLLYNNVWNNIDVEFFLPEEGGLKYNFILHPGANPDDIRLEYPNSIPSIQKDGSLIISCDGVVFNDKFPVAYEMGDKKEVLVESRLNENVLTFKIDNYDLEKTLVIDPWITTPLAELDNKGFRVDYDYSGNVFVLGGLDQTFATGYSGTIVNKYSSDGSLIWTWTETETMNSVCGDLSCNRSTGELYWVRGMSIGSNSVVLISPEGVVTNQWGHNMDASAPAEFWRCMYDQCNNELVIGSGGMSWNGVAPNQCVRFSNNLILLEKANPLGLPDLDWKDVCLMDVDNEDNSLFLMTATGVGVMGLSENRLFKVPLSDFSTPDFNLVSNYTFDEVGSVQYHNFANGHNGMAVNSEFLYLYDGNTLTQCDKLTGNINNSVLLGIMPFSHGGIDTDICGNIYVGTLNEVKVYNSSLVEITSYSLPGACFDIRINGSKLYATGQDFVSEIDITSVDFSVSSVPSDVGDCSGTATVSLSPCSNVLNDLDILWEPSGQTTVTATDLCPGLHTVSLVQGCDTIFQDTVFFEGVTCDIEVTASNDSICPDDCVDLIGNFGGDVTVTSYSWGHAPSETALTVNVCPSITTTYWLVADHDSGICSDTGFVLINVLPCGCTDSAALNYDEIALIDDGSCKYSYPSVIAPNVISPSDGGPNSVFYLRMENIERVELIILNRWGNVIKEITSPNPTWDGKGPNGKLVGDGVYFYKYKAYGEDHQDVLEGHGFIQVVNNN